MALEFRYRFVDFGTAFRPAEGRRQADQGAVDPSSLFSNELVTDVGGICCDSCEPLAVIDHHFSRAGQFPSASAAVLHKAKLIRERFAGQDGTFWLVTHRLPDFDAFCSMYLARWILSEPNAIIEWQELGLKPDGWSAGPGDIAWYDPELRGLSAEQRWPLLMASYAAIVDNGRQFSCPRNRALHSILYAAMKRGRDYRSETSGAIEFLDAVKTAIRDKQRNPRIDSVLEDSAEFAPELAMLDREVDAYGRDVRRARKVIVYLQRCEHAFADCFNQLKVRPLMTGDGLPDAAHLLLQHRRVATDGIYLRDPECLLFKEWARLDVENSSLGRGFEFTAVAYSNGRANGVANTTDYFFAIDPERANGRHLYGLWALLESAEIKRLRQQAHAKADALPRKGFEGRAGKLGGLFSDPWFDGQNYFCTIVATPNQGTLIAPPGIDPGLLDDPVAGLVRDELEHSIYRSIAGKEGKQIRLRDLSPIQGERHEDERYFGVTELIEPPVGRRFRFARVRLRDDAATGPATQHGGSSLQIAESLWQVLYPELSGAKPANFVERHVILAPQCIGVWGERGVAIAYKVPGEASDDKNDMQASFQNIVELARDIDALIAGGKELSSKPAAHSQAEPEHTEEQEAAANPAEKLAATGEGIARRAAEIKHDLALPGSELLRRFYNASGIDDLLSTLRDLNQTAADYIRREKMDEQARHLGEHTETVAEVQSKLEWVEVFIIGVYAIEMIKAMSESWRLEGHTPWFVAWGVPFFLVFAALVLWPWKSKPPAPKWLLPRPELILTLVLAICAVGNVWACRSGKLKWNAPPKPVEQEAAPRPVPAEQQSSPVKPAEQPAAPERRP